MDATTSVVACALFLSNWSRAKQCVLFLIFLGVIVPCRCQTYENSKAIYEDKLNESVYDIRVRPSLDQSRVTTVNFAFVLLSIVELDDVAQSFTCNGVAAYTWKDELGAMVDNYNEVQFNAITPTVDTTLYTVNGEWDLKSTGIAVSNITIISATEISITLKRRPTFLLINIFLPVFLLSFLNILVFLIPVDSGEKISYGITVLLSVSVFMSIVSEILPSSSDKIPAVTVYLFVLVIISVLTVVVAIIIVFLHHTIKKEKTHKKAKDNYQSVFRKFKRVERVVAPMKPLPEEDANVTSPAAILEKMKLSTTESETTETPFPNIPTFSDTKRSSEAQEKEDRGGQKTRIYTWIAKSIDGVSFIVFLTLWFLTNFIFLIYIATAN